MRAIMVWRGIALGVFFLALAAIVHYEEVTWHWMLVVLAGMSFVNSVLKGRWRFAAHPLLWAAGLAYAYASPPEPDPRHVGGWTMFFALCGASIILSFLIGLVPRAPRRPPPPRPPGAGTVLDAEVTRREGDVLKSA